MPDQQNSALRWRPIRYTVRFVKFYYDEYIVPNMGVTLTLISQFFNSLMILFCKLLLMDPDFDKPMHPFQILFVRMVITYAGCAITLVFIQHDPDFPLGPSGYRWYMIGRGIGGYISVAGQYFALMYLTVSDTISITFLAPVITSLMAYILLHERFTKAEAIGGMCAFVGVLFISRPSMIFGNPTTPEDSGDGRSLETNDPKLRLLGSLLALSAPFGTGIAMCSIRKIGFHVNVLLIVSFFALITCIISFFGIIFTPGLSFQMPRNARQWTLLILLGVSGFIMQYLLTAGMQREKASRAIVMTYFQLVYASFFDLVIFGHWPSLMSLLGELIIIVSVVTILYFKEPDPQSNDVETLPGGNPDSFELSSLSASNSSIQS